MQVYSASRIFTGNEWLTNHVVVVEDGIIQSINDASLFEGSTTLEFEGSLVPSFIDVQVYGAAGRLLAVYPDKETLHKMNEVFFNEGTVLFLPTVATNTIEVFKACIDAVRAYWNDGGEGVYGLHLEGPWLNNAKKGAHVDELIHAPTLGEVQDLISYGKDVIRMITIAPEVCSKEIIELLLSYNIILSAGHSNASLHQSLDGFNMGIQSVTHLYNAMSGLHHREPGLVGASFLHEKVKASIIADGHHVDYNAIAIAKKIMGSRLFAITDAVTDTIDGHYRHKLAGDKYECNEVLSGSALSMQKSFFNLVQYAGIEVEESLRMCSLYPAQLLECDNRYGRITAGSKALFNLLDHQNNFVKTITG